MAVNYGKVMELKMELIYLKTYYLAVGNSMPLFSINIGGFNYFVTNDSMNGKSIWKTDGTFLGTTLVKKIPVGEFGTIFINTFTELNGILYFIALNATGNYKNFKNVLWKSDGTEAGTIIVKEFIFYSEPEVYKLNGILYMNTTDNLNGFDLWKSDGTTSGTVLVKDFISIDNIRGPKNFVAMNNILYFYASTINNGWELWKSDGTSKNTTIVKDINIGHNDGVAYYNKLVVSNNKLFFFANNGLSGNELWKSDGTKEGTVLVKNCNPSTISSFDYYQLIDVNNTLFYSFNNRTNGLGIMDK